LHDDKSSYAQPSLKGGMHKYEGVFHWKIHTFLILLG
jgi:hypothetical protein